MARESSSDCEQSAPLLGADAPVNPNNNGRTWSRSLPRPLRWWGRWPLLIAVAAVCFIAGLATPLTLRESIVTVVPYPANPKLDDSVRVHVLSRLLQQHYPHVPGSKPRELNWAALDRLASCLKTDSCTDSERKVFILSSNHFGNSELGMNGGEDVWARSMISSFRHLNHTILFAYGSMETLFMYQGIPDMVTAVIWEEATRRSCVNRNETNYLEIDEASKEIGAWQTGKHACSQSVDFPHGIPHWKSFSFHFWPGSEGVPLGPRWVLSPENYEMWQGETNRTYIGYSIEKRCDMYPTFTNREHRALVLAKKSEYFQEKHNAFYRLLGPARDSVPPVHNDQGEEVKFSLISTAGQPGDKIDAEGIETIGRKNQREWTEILARSKVLLGIGVPVFLPSPYYALCMGVPFINPVHGWDQNDPDNRDKWVTQQNALRYTEEPFVYHVKQMDLDGLRDALQRAADTPISRYIPPPMRFEAMVERIRKFVETDWHNMAREYVADHYKNATEWQFLAMDEPAEPVPLWGKSM
ncbi:hypothetical protein CspeluHIS016_0404160 [Cutaneotrichosporon spelunceum]|uniref:Glycosyltransferase family 18 catalytic domain-containing protein n=1 Tax=Cutaneotrichosporon spelunceum TaxID=1672016 RepID=A0AAD3TW98_9TREE|nr:hypothetical protein CspeluHIS016_0404160 [Cutaneotrichosporon spelunceum]